MTSFPPPPFAFSLLTWYAANSSFATDIANHSVGNGGIFVREDGNSTTTGLMVGHMHMMMDVLIFPGQQSHCRRLLLNNAAVDPTVCLCCVLKQ